MSSIEKAVGKRCRSAASSRSSSPDIRDVKLEEGQPLTFKAEFDVVPLVRPGRVLVDRGAAHAGQRRRRRRRSGARTAARARGAVRAGRRRHRRRRATPWSSISSGKASTRKARRRRRRSTKASRSKSAPPRIRPGFDDELIGLDARREQVVSAALPGRLLRSPELAGNRGRLHRTRARHPQRASCRRSTTSSPRTSASSRRSTALRDRVRAGSRGGSARTPAIARCAPTC